MTFLDAHDVAEVITSTADHIDGVRVINRDNDNSSFLTADMVVDAMGRAARTPALLETLGYGRPPERQPEQFDDRRFTDSAPTNKAVHPWAESVILCPATP